MKPVKITGESYRLREADRAQHGPPAHRQARLAPAAHLIKPNRGEGREERKARRDRHQPHNLAAHDERVIEK